MNWMQGNVENNRENKRNLDDFFGRGTSMQGKNARAQRNNGELHLELVGDKVTYVRIY